MQKILTVLTILTIASGCTESPDAVAPYKGDDAPRLHACIEPTDSRAYIDGTKTYWNAADEITVFSARKNEMSDISAATYSFSGKDGESEGDFELSRSLGSKPATIVPKGYCAIYPSLGKTDWRNDGLIESSVLAGFFAPVTDNVAFPPNAATLVAATAYPDDCSLHFRHVTGYVLVQVWCDQERVLSSARFSGNKGEIVAGDVIIKASADAEPEVELSSDSGSTYIRLSKLNGRLSTDSAHPTELWFPMIPTVFDEGFTITLTDDLDRAMTISTTKQQTVRRGEVLRMPPVKAVLEIPDNEIWVQASDSFSLRISKNVDSAANFGATYLKTDYLGSTDRGWNLRRLVFDGPVTRCGAGIVPAYSIDKVILPPTVRTIGDKAFEGFAKLDTVETSPATVEYGDSVFSGCTSLKKYTFPPTLQKVGTGLFCGCTALAEVHFRGADNTTDMMIFEGKYAFRNCPALNRFTSDVPYDRRMLDDDGKCLMATADNGARVLVAFAPANLPKRTILSKERPYYLLPPEVCIIGTGALCGVGTGAADGEALEAIEYDSNVFEIRDEAFYNCPALRIVQPRGLPATLGDNVFGGPNAPNDLTLYTNVDYFQSLYLSSPDWTRYFW